MILKVFFTITCSKLKYRCNKNYYCYSNLIKLFSLLMALKNLVIHGNKQMYYQLSIHYLRINSSKQSYYYQFVVKLQGIFQVNPGDEKKIF